MNFQLAKTGQSFKGAFAYYLHDKRSDSSGPHPVTADRVAWTEVLNLAHDDPAYAQSVMIATARNAAQIKKDAGIKATGRKSTAGPVFAYSIAWHPDKESLPDQAGMMDAVKGTLKVLGADGRQVVVIAHRDAEHPHVHILINRVDPATGIMLDLHKNADKLDKWAAKYERDRDQIVSPNRDAKHEARKRLQMQQAFTAAAAPAPERVVPANDRLAGMQPQQAKPKTRAALLFERQQAQRVRHRQEWADLSAANKARRAAVYAERIDWKGMVAEHRRTTRPQWSELGKVLAAERRAFLDREKRLSGILRNAINVVRGQKIRGNGEDRGFLSMAFAFTVNGPARRAAFAARQQEAKDQLAARLDAALQKRFAAAKEGRATKLADMRSIYGQARSELIARQDLEKARIGDEWRRFYAEREKLAQAGERSRERMIRRNGQNYRQDRRVDRATRRPSIGSQAKVPDSTLQQEFGPVKSEFDKSARLPAANQSPPPMETERVSVSYPAPHPTPGGLPVPPQRVMRDIPKVDRAAEHASQQAGPGPESAKDAFRRSYPPAPAQPQAANQDKPPTASAAEFRRNAAAVPSTTSATPALKTTAAQFRQAAGVPAERRPDNAPSQDLSL